MRFGLDVRLTYYTAGGISKYVARIARDVPALAPRYGYTHFYRRGHAAEFSPVARRVDCMTPAHHRAERWSLALEVLPHRLDVLHSPDFIPPAFGYRRSVITVHDLNFLHYPQFLTDQARRYYNGNIAWAVRRAALISADSLATKADLVNLLGVADDRVVVVYPGLDPEFTAPAEPGEVAATLARHALAPGYILFVGTFEPRKNVAGLLAAYALWRSHQPGAPPLVLVGRQGWLFESTAARVRELGLEAVVRFLPELPAADLPNVYRGASVLVLPSHYEGFGFPVLEAMAAGTPVIAANRASLPEIAGDAALLVEPDQPESIAAALEHALTDTGERSRMIERGRERSLSFTWAETARQTLALYERAAAS
jgi:glycosyltransferase involved in cell wall biosynthesis